MMCISIIIHSSKTPLLYNNKSYAFQKYIHIFNACVYHTTRTHSPLLLVIKHHFIQNEKNDFQFLFSDLRTKSEISWQRRIF